MLDGSRLSSMPECCTDQTVLKLSATGPLAVEGFAKLMTEAPSRSWTGMKFSPCGDCGPAHRARSAL